MKKPFCVVRLKLSEMMENEIILDVFSLLSKLRLKIFHISFDII